MSFEGMKTRRVSRFAALLAVLVLLAALTAPAYAAGAQPPVADNAYQISTKDNLVWFRDEVNSGKKSYNAVLTANINLSGDDWTPIGTSANKFAGKFDGKGFEISNLAIDNAASSSNGRGLFGYIDASGTVANIVLRNVSLNCYNYIGGVAGDNAGKIINCRVSGSISGNQRVGGIVGTNKPGAEILHCRNSASVTGKNGMVGGIAGEFAGTIRYSANLGAVSSDYTAMVYVGGLAGNKATGTSSAPAVLFIDNSFNAGTVAAAKASAAYGYAGGILGASAAGSSTSSVIIKNSFNYGKVTTPGNYRGAIAGGSITGTYAPTLENFYYLDESSDKIYNGGDQNPSGVTKKTAAEFSAAAELEETNSTIEGFKLKAEYWEMLPEAAYPTLKDANLADIWAEPPTPPALRNYDIGTAEDLTDAAEEINDDTVINRRQYTGTITLKNGIDLSDSEWKPIKNFAGTFDGGGNKIIGLEIIDARTSSFSGGLGFFEKLYEGSVVKDLILDGVLIDANMCSNVGAIAGTNAGGQIENCFVSGEITARSNAGGIAGVHETGIVKGCGSDVVVTATTEDYNSSYAGGIAGRIGGLNTSYTGTAEAEDVYSLGRVSGNGSYVGGLFGQINAGTEGTVSVKNAYSLCEIEPTKSGKYYAPISGNSTNSTVERVYYLAAPGVSGIYQVNVTSGIVQDTLTTAKTLREFARAGGTDSVLSLLNTASPDKWKLGAYSPILAFQPDQTRATYTVTVSAEGSGNAKLSGGATGATYEIASEVTAEAEPRYEAAFLGWFEGDSGTPISTNTSYTFILSRDTTLTAKFGEPDPNALWYNPDEDSYTLVKKEEFLYFAKLVNDGETFAGKVVTLDSDETFYLPGSPGWSGIGTESQPFAGIFNGAGHEIEFQSPTSAGLFNALAKDGKIQAVTVSGDITATSGHIGGVVSVNNGLVEACRFKGKLTRVSSGFDDVGYAGGIVGYNFGGIVKNCVNDAEIAFEGYGSENTGVGGVAGYSVGIVASMPYNTNNGRISGEQSVGGIVGKLMSSNNGEDTGVSHSENNGPITGTSDVGGIAGLSYNSLVSESVNNGLVAGSNGRAFWRFGGIVGYNKEGEIKWSSNFGAIVADTAAEVGGITGWNSNLIDHCFNMGAVSGKSEVGGVAGRILTGALAAYTYNNGAVTGVEKYVGGISGFNEDAVTVVNGYSNGRVTGGDETNTGGIFGALTNHYGDDPEKYVGSVYKNLYFDKNEYQGDAYKYEDVNGGKGEYPEVENVTGLAEAKFSNGDAVILLNTKDTNDSGTWIQGEGKPIYGDPSDPAHTPPALTEISKQRASDVSATVTFTSSEDGIYYWEAVESGEGEPVLDTRHDDGLPISAGEETMIFLNNALDYDKEYDVYIKAKDGDGNVSGALKITIEEYIPIYDALPKIVTAEEGNPAVVIPVSAFADMPPEEIESYIRYIETLESDENTSGEPLPLVIKAAEPADDGAAQVLRTSIPIAFLQKWNNEGRQPPSFTVSNSRGEFGFDTQAKKDLIEAAGGDIAADEDTVELSIDKYMEDDPGDQTPLTQAQKDALKEQDAFAVYDVSILVGDKKIGNFVTSGTLRIGLPYDLKKGEKPDGVWVFYVAEDGKIDWMTKGRSFDAGRKITFFTTNHLSYYGETYKEIGGSGSNGGCDAGTGALMALVLAAVGGAMRRKD
jgi:hypothetical protein